MYLLLEITLFPYSSLFDYPQNDYLQLVSAIS